MAEIVAQQIEDHAGLVRIADRHVAGRLDPEVDIGVDLVVPMNVDDDAAGRAGAAHLLLLLADMGERHGADHEIGEDKQEQHVAEGDIHPPPHGSRTSCRARKCALVPSQR